MKNRVLITGASKGIGKATAEAFATQGWEVIGTCRNPGKLTKSDRVEGVRYLPLDLTRERSIDALVRGVKEVDVLVNNAGASPIGPAEEAPMNGVRDLFQLNLFGPIRLTQALLAPMRRKGRGAVIFIGSMRSEWPSPFSSIYSATKAAVRSFASCLRMEVKRFGVRVAVIAPWGIRTTLSQGVQCREKSPYRDAVRRVKRKRDAIIASSPSPALVAEKILKVATNPRPKSFHSVGRNARFLSFLARHLPKGIIEAISGRTLDL